MCFLEGEVEHNQNARSGDLVQYITDHGTREMLCNSNKWDVAVCSLMWHGFSILSTKLGIKAIFITNNPFQEEKKYISHSGLERVWQNTKQTNQPTNPKQG